MSVLSYAVFTDPAPLQVSQPDMPSVGSVYVTVSNSNATEVRWDYIAVDVPSGSGSGDLTEDVTAINPRIETDYVPAAGEEAAQFTFVSTRGNFLAAAPSLRRMTLPPGGSFTLILEDIPMSGLAGLARLKIREYARCDGSHPMHVRHLAFALPKSTPKIPRNFHADTTLVDVDAGDTVTLRWDGPDNLDYWIRTPDGQEELAQKAGSGPGVSLTSYQWPVTSTPARGTTYTLVGRAPQSAGQPDRGYFLTTTVHARIPEFESGTRTPWIEEADNASRVAFSPTGVDILSGGSLGTVTADEGILMSALRTKRARGLDDGDGWVEFPADGIRVGHGGDSELGTVTAERVSANGVNTAWVQGRGTGDGWISFPQSGVQVYKDGKREWGTVDADKADLNGVLTKWVQGRGDSAGWIEFPAAGVNVFQGAGNRQWGTLAADKADLNDLDTVRARVKERLILQGGLTVDGVLDTQEGPSRLVVHGRLDAEGDLNAAGNVVAGGDLTVNGDLRPMRDLEVAGAVTTDDLTVRDKLTTVGADHRLTVHGESLFSGRVNANGQLSVRNGTDWLVHVNDDQVSVQGNLRVHGAFRSDN
ncbi:hypothetical protein Stsp01_55790 [Streptomyces sp. NBRC 13847]|uniref:hypothetical protein n=1 Tax=Streptomyces TaxID=1883 RepID=UPI0024A17C7E|nr:hypothetical protein [Streptomyces sp. NBRC 13847]GLW18836.1 hypothetical protein Stsp01_55790 [Streptomyces sp. NBRC 13847]